MGSMSYCKFRNTLDDLSQCYDSWEEPIESDEEIAAQRRLIKLCQLIASEYGEE